jgi:uncharacterized spore protein YtfJ
VDEPADVRGEGAIDSVLGAIERARDAITVRRVYGEPVERDGVTLVPAAAVRGGGGGGGGGDAESGGAGTGFGLSGRPVGAYVIADGEAYWEPVIDRTRVILGVQVVVAAALILLAVVLGRQPKESRRGPFR